MVRDYNGCHDNHWAGEKISSRHALSGYRKKCSQNIELTAIASLPSNVTVVLFADCISMCMVCVCVCVCVCVLGGIY